MSDPTPTPKKMFAVFVREVHVQKYLIEATNESAAIQAVADGEGEIVEENGMEDSHSLDPDLWTAEAV